MQRLEELMGHVRRCHSELQIRHFVVVKGGAFCDYGALRQALREVHTRVGIVRELFFRIEEAEIDIAEKRDEIDRMSVRRLSTQKANVQLRRLTSQLVDMNRDLGERAYELAHCYAIACALKDKIEGEHGPLTPALHAKLDVQMWEHRLRLDAATEIRMQGRLQPSTVQSIRSLPSATRRSIIAAISDRVSFLEWHDAQSYDLPEIGNVMEGEEVLKYVADTDRSSRRIGSADYAAQS